MFDQHDVAGVASDPAGKPGTVDLPRVVRARPIHHGRSRVTPFDGVLPQRSSRNLGKVSDEAYGRAIRSRLQAVRQEHCLSLENLEQRSQRGFTVDALARWESGERVPS